MKKVEHVKLELTRPRLTRIESRLFEFLRENSDKTISKESLFEVVWDYPNNSKSRTITTHLCRLRKKLRGSSIQIETIAKKYYRYLERN